MFPENFSARSSLKVLCPYLTDSEIRPTNPNYAQGYKITFTDAFPFLIASQVQLRALCSTYEGCVYILLNTKLKLTFPVTEGLTGCTKRAS